MSYDKVIDSAQLDGALSATADAIRAKTGDAAQIAWDASSGFASAISGISSGAKVATGTFTIAALDSSKYYDMSTRGAITVSGIGFTPTRVIAYLSSGTIGGTFHQLIIADIGEQNGFFTTNKSTVAPSINVFTASLNADGFTLDMVEGATRPYVVQGTWFYIAIG